jgi:hypothetical protein
MLGPSPISVVGYQENEIWQAVGICFDGIIAKVPKHKRVSEVIPKKR